MDERDPLTHAVIGAAIEVHREMGPGLLESVYQACLLEEFTLRGLSFEAQARLPLIYKGKVLNDPLILDFFFPGLLVVEIKAVEKLIPVHEAQLLSYLRLTKTRVGLLLNFNVPVLKDGLKRMVL
jgi:GxxExxY protein